MWAVLRYTYRTIKLFIPLYIYLTHLPKNTKLIKLVIPWLTSNLVPSQNPLKDKVPWITFEAQSWLKEYLSKNMVVFEYGSGGSTLFFSKRVKKLISVEHDNIWYSRVFDILKDENISNCTYLLFKPQLAFDNQPDFTDPYGFTSNSPEYTNMSFETYVKTLDKFPDNSFDLVFIDGRTRPSCILHALDKVRPGGFLMLDNSEREYYLAGIKLLADWKRTDFFGPGPYGRYFWQTSIWKK